MNESRTAIIIGISSGIGQALGQKWLRDGYKIFGTYRTEDKTVQDLKNSGATLVNCDLADPASIDHACKELSVAWDVLVLCPATLIPISPFTEVDMNDWGKSIDLNFTNQIRVVQALLSSRRKNSKPESCIIFFSGGGINEAPTNYSAYVVSKIAVVKMAEILDVEIPDARFVSIGPGWVDTKIHQETLKAGAKAGRNYNRTVEKMNKQEFTPMEKVLDCCDWIANASKKVIGGRNIHVLYDNWNNPEFEKKLIEDDNLLKLRKYGSVNK